MNNLTLKKNPLIYTFWVLAGLTFTWRVFEQDSLNLIFTPLLSLILIYDYHRKIADDQALYFSFFFCMLGDIMTISSDFYYFTSGLIAYWGASILFYFTLNRELEVPFRTAIKKPSFFLPFLIYGLSLSLTCAMGLAVYWHKKTTPTLHFAKGLVILSVTASLIGINRFYLKNSLVYGVETLLYAPSLFYIFMYFKTKTQRAL
ncbi:MAG: hypothetical protein ACPG7X_08280 [Flavobacteriaceae bacterium]